MRRRLLLLHFVVDQLRYRLRLHGVASMHMMPNHCIGQLWLNILVCNCIASMRSCWERTEPAWTRMHVRLLTSTTRTRITSGMCLPNKMVLFNWWRRKIAKLSSAFLNREILSCRQLRKCKTGANFDFDFVDSGMCSCCRCCRRTWNAAVPKSIRIKCLIAFTPHTVASTVQIIRFIVAIVAHVVESHRFDDFFSFSFFF